MRIVFFNISYMNYYKGKDDTLIGNFRYVKKKTDGGETLNFAPFKADEREVGYGFMELAFTKGGFEKVRQRQIHIEKIMDADNSGEKLDNVVVWCAKLPETESLAIVGWYKDTTVYREVITSPYNKETDRWLPEFVYWYYVVADKSKCVLLPIEERKKDKWRAYYKSHNSNDFGFGQSNMWYAREESAQEYVSSIIKQIEEYKGENLV